MSRAQVRTLFAIVLMFLMSSSLFSQSALDKWRNKAKQKIDQVEGNVNSASSPSSNTGTSSTVGSGTPTQGQHNLPGASTPVRNGSPDDSLWRAVTLSHASECEDAIARGANVNNSPATGVYAGTTPLLNAIPLTTTAGQPDGLEVVKCLVEHGADVNAAPIYQGKQVNRPITKASIYRHADIVIYLASKGANVNTQLLPPDNAQFQDEVCLCQTPLVFAIRGQNPDAVNALIAAGADVQMKLGDREKVNHTMLDLAQATLNSADAVYKRSQTVETRKNLDNACSIYNALKAHGAVTGPGSAESGNPACNESAAEKSAEDSTVQAKDDSRMLEEVDRSTRYCSNNPLLSSLYECSCFSQKILGYRKEHGMHEPFINIVQKVQYSECVGPPSQISAYGEKRTRQVLGPNPNYAAQLDTLSKCTGDDFAKRFLAKPVPNSVYVDGYFNSSLTVCRERSH